MCYGHYKENSKFQPQCALEQVLETHLMQDFHGLPSSNAMIKIPPLTDPKMVVEIATKNSFLLSTWIPISKIYNFIKRPGYL